ncbi:MAG: GntR family transcriptional regulator [Pirellulales bacterium]|nr:GntR family transcriptional regulator [Pirellulales bacterium]
MTQILEHIFQGVLPAGTQLVVRKLAAQMGVSATPIREALVELESIGVVQFAHNRGAVVKPFGSQQLREIYHLRRILESEAARCACGRIDPKDLQDLKRNMWKLLEAPGEENAAWSEQAMALDRRLHQLIASHCGDTRLADEISRYDSLVQTIREIVGNQRRLQQSGLKEHLPIIDALLVLDAEEAAVAMTRHINHTLESVVAVMFQAK